LLTLKAEIVFHYLKRNPEYSDICCWRTFIHISRNIYRI